jgi:hypothetical protein
MGLLSIILIIIAVVAIVIGAAYLGFNYSIGIILIGITIAASYWVICKLFDYHH